MSATTFPIVPIGNVCRVQSGFAFKSADWRDEGHAVVRIGNVKPGFLDLTDCVYVTDAIAQKAKEFRLRDGDILISMTGYIGVVAHVRGSTAPLLNQRVGRFRDFDRTKIEPNYLYHVLRDETVRKRVELLGHGAAQPNISPSAIQSVEIPVPSLSTQRRIASILCTYDDLIEVNRRRVAVLEGMARGLFEEWFVRLRFPGHENHKIIDTPDGPLPEGWRWAAFSSIADEVRESVSPADVAPETRYVGLEHIPRRSTTLNDYGRADEVGSLKLHFRRGDVLFGKIRPYFHKVAWAPCDGVASSDTIVFRPKHGAYHALTLLVAASDDFVAKAVQTSNGTKMPRANPSVLRAYKVPIGADTITAQFEAAAFPMIELAAVLQAANETLSAARDLLLPRLISGELSIAAAEHTLQAAA